MSKQVIFRGAATALITPFTETGIDYENLGRLIDWQIEEGTDAIVICGTTGESSTMTDEEHQSCIAYAAERINGRIPLIAGTGSNDTAYAVNLTRFAKSAGADAALVVTPYYNKATQKGLIRHFNAIADEGGLPVILYNVPSRTGCSIEPATYAELAKNENIVGIKEANANIVKIVETMALVGDNITLYSGNDDEITPLMALGAQGCISVLSNLLPGETSRLCHLCLEGDYKKANELQFRYLPLINALFSEVNPIPVKAAMNAMGWCSDVIRMPLTEMDEAKREKMLGLMREQGISV